MLARRLLVLVAVLMGVTALAAALAPPPPAPRPVSPKATRDAPARSAAPPIARTLDAASDRPRPIDLRLGQTLRLTVTSPSVDTVELVGLDRWAIVSPEAPAELDVLADREGVFPVVLHEGGRTIGRLRVRREPAGADAGA